jgi:uracil-DNA glycosylase family 4
MIKAEGAKCEDCPLRQSPYVPSFIPDGATIAVVGEAPGAEEVREKAPFVGPSGKLLRALIENEGYEYERLLRTNVVACRPFGNRPPELDEIECCSGRLRRELEQSGVSTIISLGRVANEVLCGDFSPSERGFWKSVADVHIMPTWHPAYVLRKPNEVGGLARDLRIALSGYQPPRFETNPEPIIIRDVPTLEDWLSRCPENAWASYDLETDNVIWYDRPSSRADPVLMLLILWDERFGLVLDDVMLYDTEGVIPTLQKFFNRKDVTFCTQNGKFDQVFMLSHFGLRARNDFDTMMAHHCLDENESHGLKAQAAAEFGMRDYEEDLVQKHLRNRNDRYSKVPFEDLAQYGVLDVAVTRALALIYDKRLRALGMFDWPFKNVLTRASEMFVDVEIAGIPVDVEYLHQASDQMTTELLRLDKEAEAMIGYQGINLNSTQQVANVLYDSIGFPQPLDKGVKSRSTRHEILLKLAGKHPFVDLMLYQRRVQKLHSSYVVNMLEYVDVNGYIHPTVYPTGTEIGRLAYRDPAAQTVPRPGDKSDLSHTPYADRPYTDGALIRGAIAAIEGMMFAADDYSQAELRVAACLANEPFLKEVYRNNRDLHSEVALAMFGPGFTKEQRVRTKMFNFSYLYGGNEYSFAMDAGLPISVARQFVRDYNTVMPRLAQFRKDQYALLNEQGYVSTIFGRRRRFPLITNKNVDDARKSAVHMPVAGTASDLTLLSAMDCWDDGIPVMLLVHDSILAHGPESQAPEMAQHIAEAMRKTGEKWLPDVPWKVDTEVRKRWATPPKLS